MSPALAVSLLAAASAQEPAPVSDTDALRAETEALRAELARTRAELAALERGLASDRPEDGARTSFGRAVTVIAGESHGVTGAVTRETTEPLYLDLHLPAGASFEQILPAGHNAFVYVYRGAVSLGGQAVPMQRMAILANEPGADGVRIEASADAKLLLIAGRPLNEPIAQYGPFVMNSEAEIYQAVQDFRSGKLG